MCRAYIYMYIITSVVEANIYLVVLHSLCLETNQIYLHLIIFGHKKNTFVPYKDGLKAGHLIMAGGGVGKNI